MAGTVLRRIGIAAAVLALVADRFARLLRDQPVEAASYLLDQSRDARASRCSATIAQAGHLVPAISKCVECHGEDLGGSTMDVGPLGTFSAATSPAAGAEWAP